MRMRTGSVVNLCLSGLLFIFIIILLVTSSFIKANASNTEVVGGYMPATCTVNVKKVIAFSINGPVTEKASTYSVGKQLVKKDGKVEVMLQTGTETNKNFFIFEIQYENFE